MEKDPNSCQRHGTASKQPPALILPPNNITMADARRNEKREGEDEVKECRRLVLSSPPRCTAARFEIGRSYSVQKSKEKGIALWSNFSSF
jgi:hypothetical protein